MLYDFEGDSGGGELTITEGDVLFVTNQVSLLIPHSFDFHRMCISVPFNF